MGARTGRVLKKAPSPYRHQKRAERVKIPGRSRTTTILLALLVVLGMLGIVVGAFAYSADVNQGQRLEQALDDAYAP
jgi:hypothetical protein